MSITTKSGVRELFTLIAIVISFHFFHATGRASVTGHFYPTGTTHEVLAVKGSDSIKVISTDGEFGLRLTPGAWKVVIPVNPQQPTYIERTVRVTPGQRVDLGQIRLLR